MTCSDAASLIPLYLTGELDEARTHEFLRHTHVCADCAREASEQAAFDARMRAAILSEPVDPAAVERRVVQKIAAEKATRTRRWGFAAAGIAALLTIGVYGYFFRPGATRTLAAAARDHRLEIEDHQPRKWRTDLVSVTEVAAREGISTSEITRLAPASYHFEEGKLCLLNGRLYLHLVYADAAGDRKVSVFLDGRNQHTGMPVNTSTFGAENVAGFSTGSVTAMVVTDQSRDAAREFARYAAAAI
jgi:anti-sigma factor RsiW